ncbi:MAG TPA: ABC transporter permease [Candidatus Eisenbacteria bacterium]|nr:ABC transporter permease [Candidatus Eisenbacteria bacterium]
MRLRDLFELSLEAQGRHRVRTALTLGGIAIGVAAVVILTSLGTAAKAYVVNQFAGLGTNLVIVLPGKVETSGFPTFGGATRDLTIEDVESLLRRAPAVRRAAPLSMGTARFVWGGRHRDVRVVGTTSEFRTIRNLELRVGQFLPPGDPRIGGPVAVIGANVQREVFAGENPIGQAVRIGKTRFRVIGALEPQGANLGLNVDDMVMVPVAIGMRMFDQTSLFRIFTQANTAEDVPVLIRQVTRVLIDRHDGLEDFTLITQAAMLKTFQSVIDALTVSLAGIAAISLAVAGIGIMNVMLVSVSERAPEVGLLKALGARRRQILSVFLSDAVIVSSAGALMGVVLGVIAVAIGAGVFPDFPLRPDLGWVAVVVVLAILEGAVFGLLPARRAARLSPVDGLRGKR